MSEDTFFDNPNHRNAWYNPTTSVYATYITKNAHETVKLWMDRKIRCSPCDLNDINPCKEVIDKWIKHTQESIEISHMVRHHTVSDQKSEERFEKNLREEENYLENFKDYLNELSQYVQEAKLSLAMASHPRLGKASLLSQLSSDNLRWIAEFLWD